MYKLKSKRINKKDFLIELWENEEITQTKMAYSILERDNILYELADMYNIVDIEHIDMNKLQGKPKEKVFEDVPIIPYTDVFQLENYFDQNNDDIFDRIVEAISIGITNKKKKIKLFQISNSGVYIDSLKRDWPAGLRLAHSYYLQNENYTMCDKCVSLLKKLKCKL